MLVGVRAVDRAVAIVAPVEEGRGLIRLDLLAWGCREILRDDRVARDPSPILAVMPQIVQRMAAETQNRLRGREQIPGRRAVRVMTEGAVLDHGRMLVDPGTGDVLVTARALRVGIAEGHTPVLVGIVAVEAAHHPFAYRVVGRVVQRGRDIPMALDAQNGCGVGVRKPWRRDRPEVLALGRVRIVLLRWDLLIRSIQSVLIRSNPDLLRLLLPITSVSFAQLVSFRVVFVGFFLLGACTNA